MRPRTCAVALLVALVAGCGSSSAANKSSHGAAMLSVIAAATNRTHTFHFSTTTVFLEHGGSGVPITGAAEVDRHQTILTASPPGAQGGYDILFAGTTVFVRVRSPDPTLAHPWCRAPRATSEPGVGVNPTDALTSLRDAGRVVHRVGRETIRGVATTHFRVSGHPGAEIWVDSHDLLRQYRWTHGKGDQTDTTDLFDFGVHVSIAVPEHVNACPVPTGPILPQSGSRTLPAP